jgi:hypothetical protein
MRATTDNVKLLSLNPGLDGDSTGGEAMGEKLLEVRGFALELRRQGFGSGGGTAPGTLRQARV